METDYLEIKRQIDSSSNQIRVMTVHGAKGLEAPIVILPDTGRRDITIKDDIVTLDDVPLWKPSAAEMPATLTSRIDNMKEAQFRERLRLLYVAMTRAEKWLMIAAAGNLSKDGSDWYQVTQTALGHINGVPFGTDGTVRFSEGDWDNLATVEAEDSEAKIPALEPIFGSEPKDPTPEPSPLSPSQLKGAKALHGDVGEDRDAALSYGSLVHNLLEALAPLDPAHWPLTARRFADGFAQETFEMAQAEAIQTLRNPALSHLFVGDWLAEASVTADVAGRRLHGDIDRLHVAPDKISIIDFKTNRIVPKTAAACPDGLLAQMGAYAAILAQIYPDRDIETSILWTVNGELMPLPSEIVSSALTKALELDDPPKRS
jgi:ATP-dependent helicase/nuclease subunit A